MTDFDDATLKITETAKGPPIRAAGVLISVTAGPDVGATFAIQDMAHRRVLVGQSPACDVRLTDRAVSRRHLSIELDGQRFRVIDLGSRNGTLVGSCEIKEVFLRPGAELVGGQTTLRLELDGGVHEILSSSESRFHRVLGASPEMRRLYPLFERLVSKPTHVLLEGEAGTGKELVAESIHDAEGRPDAPFIVFEPAAVPPERLEADLFGDPDHAAPGALARANGGSLFLDEVGDLPGALQVRLLRALERSELRRPDGGREVLQVRVFASTCRNLDAEVQNRRFRDDLLLALANPRIELPPLRKRDGDIAFLTRCFWAALGGNVQEIPPSLLQRFGEHEWPGNVRELYFAVGRVFAIGDPALPTPLSSQSSSAHDFMEAIILRDLALPVAREEVIAEFERRYMEHMLAKHGGHVGHAATASGIGRRYFQKLRAKR
jgi:DNA-binding NtrC family response regulator